MVADKPKSAPAPAPAAKGGFFGKIKHFISNTDVSPPKKPDPAAKKGPVNPKKNSKSGSGRPSSGKKGKASSGSFSGSGSSSSSSAAAPKKRFRSKYSNPFGPRVVGVSDCPYPFVPPRPGCMGPIPGFSCPRPPLNCPYPPPWGFPPPPPPPGRCPPPMPGMCPPLGACPQSCGPKTVIRVPKGQRPPFLNGPWGGGAAQPPSYNNCNFYTTQPPPMMPYPPPFLPPPPPFMPQPPCMPGPGAGRAPCSLQPPPPFHAHQGYEKGGPCKPMRSISPSLSLADSDFLSHLESLARSSSPLVMPNSPFDKVLNAPNIQNRNNAHPGPATNNLRKSM